MNAHARAKGGGEEGKIPEGKYLSLAHERSPNTVWANMRMKVGVTRSLRTLKVDLCANGAGAYAPYAPPPAYGLDSGGS